MDWFWKIRGGDAYIQAGLSGGQRGFAPRSCIGDLLDLEDIRHEEKKVREDIRTSLSPIAAEKLSANRKNKCQ